jgi:hypothetical protein
LRANFASAEAETLLTTGIITGIEDCGES